MKASQSNSSESHALIKRPPLAVVPRGEGHAEPVDAGTGPSLEARIREAAYALYEKRGREDGHDLDDWLTAETALGR